MSDSATALAFDGGTSAAIQEVAQERLQVCGVESRHPSVPRHGDIRSVVMVAPGPSAFPRRGAARRHPFVRHL